MDSLFKTDDDKKAGRTVLILVGVALALYFGMKFVNQIKTFGTIGLNPHDASTIDVTGTGDAFAIPDVAAVNFNIEQKSQTIHDAQVSINTKMGDVMAFLKLSGIAEKDIKTVNYSASPEYTYPNPCDALRPCFDYSKQKFLDYNVTQSVTVKIRNTDKAGSVVDGLGAIGVTGMSGPDFTVDDDTAVQAQARKEAIDNAQAKAKILAKSLGVHLGDIIRFTEGGNTPSPMYAKSEMAFDSVGATPPAQVPAGQNKYSSTVTITYQIR
jgi:uncharacterized protein YggE